jgi:hypothetical protein
MAASQSQDSAGGSEAKGKRARSAAGVDAGAGGGGGAGSRSTGVRKSKKRDSSAPAAAPAPASRVQPVSAAASLVENYRGVSCVEFFYKWVFVYLRIFFSYLGVQTVDDTDALDCGVCFLPLKPPIFQVLYARTACPNYDAVILAPKHLSVP